MLELVLIRHGETDWNLEGRYTGQTDIPLNATGRQQATKIAEDLKDLSLQSIYCSDLLRAKETAEALTVTTGARLLIDPRLREIDQGIWEGLSFQEIRRRFTETLESRKSDPLHVAPPRGENVAQVRERVLAAFLEILKAHPEGTVAIVAHGLVLAIIKVHIQNLPIEVVWDLIPENAQPEFLSMEA